jgi:hypothetical protein
VLVLIDVHTRLPLAMKVVKIQEYEGRWLVPLLEQAERNLGTRGHISTIVIDRGYLDGEDLWQVHQKGVLFVVVSKANMTVTLDAQALAKRERVQARERVVRHGHGKTAREERLRTELVGIEGLTTYDTYGEAEQTQYAHRRDYEGQPINAVVVRRWNNRAPATDGTVYLTNGPVSDPFVVFDTYDWRSVIENGIFKEGKHPWHLGHFPKKTEAAVVVHCHFTEAFDGAMYRLPLVASAICATRATHAICEACPLADAGDGPPSQLDERAAGGRGDCSLALAAEGRKSGQGHRFFRRCLWHLPFGRTGDLDGHAPPSPPIFPWFSPNHPSALWHQHLILI